MVAQLTLCALALAWGGDNAEKKAVLASFELTPVEQQLIALTNAQRAQFGLPPLDVDPNLVNSARTHTAWMANSHRMQHTSQPVAENIAMGQQSGPHVIQSWMNSPGHRANLLHGGYRRIGVAAYLSPNGTPFWCQQFLP